jgi:predicted ATP-dependent endonuclease of OLD family
MTIITQLFWSEPGDLIMIEEPETSLHPEFQVLLQELFAEAVRDGRQIVYSTHSPFLILALSRVIGKGILSRDDIAIYHVEKGDRGTKVKQLRLNDRGFVSGWIPTRILLIRAIRRILELERAEAERSDRAKPSLSAIVEMLLRKGIKAYYAEDKK